MVVSPETLSRGSFHNREKKIRVPVLRIRRKKKIERS